MARLAVARGEHIERIYRESHTLWGGGLTLPDYLALWRQLADTAWARRFVHYYVWLGEGDRLLSSFKLYRPRIRIVGRESRAAVVGAVFTPRARRGQGHASAMIRAALDEAVGRGDHPAVLFSDIGTGLYSALGFAPLPAEECWGRLGRHGSRGPSGWRLRDVEPRDMAAVREMHEAWCAKRPLAFLRDESHWEFLLARTREFFARLADRRLQAGFQVADHDGRALGYAVTVEGHGELSIREVGAEGGDDALMADVVRATLASARARGLRRVYAWLPPEVAARLRDWKLKRAPRRRAIPMMRPLAPGADLSALGSPEAAFIPYQDQF